MMFLFQFQSKTISNADMLKNANNTFQNLINVYNENYNSSNISLRQESFNLLFKAAVDLYKTVISMESSAKNHSKEEASAIGDARKLLNSLAPGNETRFIGLLNAISQEKPKPREVMNYLIMNESLKIGNDPQSVFAYGVFQKCKDYITAQKESIADKNDPKIGEYDNALSIINKFPEPAISVKPNEFQGPKNKGKDENKDGGKSKQNDERKDGGKNTGEPIKDNTRTITTTESALAIEKKIFESLKDGVAPPKELYESLEKLISKEEYINFRSVAEGGVVNGKFFTAKWSYFQTLVRMVNESALGMTRTGAIFSCKTEGEAEALKTALEQIDCIKFTRQDLGDMKEADNIAKLKNPFAVSVIFTYAGERKKSNPNPVTTKQTDEQADLRVRTYETYSKDVLRTDKNAPSSIDEIRMDEVRLKSANSFYLDFNTSQQVIYTHGTWKNGNLVPILDEQSIRLINYSADSQLKKFLFEKNLTFESLKSMKTEDKIELIKQMKVVGAATLEVPSKFAWNYNHELATARGNAMGEAIIRSMFNKEMSGLKPKEQEKYVLGIMGKFDNEKGVAPEVVSIWSTSEIQKLDKTITPQSASEVLNSYMRAIQKNEGEGAVDSDKNFSNSGFLYSILTGDYKTASKLVSDSKFSTNEKKKLSNLVKSVESSSGGTPAIRMEDGKFVISNTKLMQKLILEQSSGGIGLRYEANTTNRAGQLITDESIDAKEGIGAYFVSILEGNSKNGYNRSASLLTNAPGTLDIHLENYFAKNMPDVKHTFGPLANFNKGADYTVTVSVGYKIGDANANFSNGVVNCYMNNASMDAKFIRRREDGRYEYQFSFTAPQKEKINIEATARKFFDEQRTKAVDSGYVYAPLKPMPVVNRIVEPPVEKKADLKSNLMELSNIPVFSANVNANYSIIKLGEDAPYSNIINNKMGEIASQNGGKEIMVNGMPYFSFSNLTPQQLIEVLNKVPEVYTAYLNSDINPNNPTGTTVRQALVNTGLISDMSQFEQHLKSKNFDAAIGLISQTGDEGKALALAFGTYKNAVSSLEYAQLAQDIENSKYGAIVEVKLDTSAIVSNTDLYLYYNNKQGNFSLTKSPYSVQTVGVRLVKKFDNARLRFQSGYTQSDSKLNVPGQWFVGIGGEYGIPLSEVLTATIQADATKTFGTKTVEGDVFNISLEDKHIINMTTGVTYDPGDVIKAKVVGGVQTQVGRDRAPSYAPFLQAGISLAPLGKGVEFIPQITMVKGRPTIYELGVRVNF